MKVKYQIIIAIISILVVSCVIFSVIIYHTQKESLLNGINSGGTDIFIHVGLVHRTLVNIILVNVIILLAGALVSFFLAEVISRPIIQLTKIANKMSAGDVTQFVYIKGNLEFEQLSDSLGKMSKVIHEKILELQVSRERFRSLTENTTDIIWETDSNGIFTYISPKCSEIFGYAPRELVGRPPFEFTTPDENIRASRKFDEIASGFRSFTAFEVTHIAKDRHAVVMETNGTPVFDAEGRFSGYRGISRDVTERKKIDKVLQRQRKELQVIFDSIPALVFYKNRENRMLQVNRMFAEVVGRPREEIEGKSAREIFPTYAPNYWRDDKEVMASGKPKKNIIEPLETASGVRLIQVDKVPYIDEDGVIVGVIGFAIDITDKANTEKELALYRDHLEDVVKERTTQLQAANKELEAFAHSVSHDLRAPLRIIDNFSQLTLEEYGNNIGDEGKHFLMTIRKNVQKMGGLIDDLLGLSRVTRQQVEMAEIDMEALAHEATEEVRNMVEPGRKVAFAIMKLPKVTGDKVMIRQVFMNLLTNAVKFTRPKEEAVIKIGADAAAGEYIYYVKDNGVGFDMTYRDKLFKLFQRLHKTEDFEGTGVGLAIIQRVIDRHGGRVWAESRPGEGAAFYFSIPM